MPHLSFIYSKKIVILVIMIVGVLVLTTGYMFIKKVGPFQNTQLQNKTLTGAFEDLPHYPNSTPNQKECPTVDIHATFDCSYITNDRASNIIDFYQQKMPALGWKLTNTTEPENPNYNFLRSLTYTGKINNLPYSLYVLIRPVQKGSVKFDDPYYKGSYIIEMTLSHLTS